MAVLGLILRDSPMCDYDGTLVLDGPCPRCGVAEGETRHRPVPAAVYTTTPPAGTGLSVQNPSLDELQQMMDLLDTMGDIDG